jgi:hypothetical protein
MVAAEAFRTIEQLFRSLELRHGELVLTSSDFRLSHVSARRSLRPPELEALLDPEGVRLPTQIP